MNGVFFSVTKALAKRVWKSLGWFWTVTMLLRLASRVLERRWMRGAGVSSVVCSASSARSRVGASTVDTFSVSSMGSSAMDIISVACATSSAWGLVGLMGFMVSNGIASIH